MEQILLLSLFAMNVISYSQIPSIERDSVFAIQYSTITRGQNSAPLVYFIKTNDRQKIVKVISFLDRSIYNEFDLEQRKVTRSVCNTTLLRCHQVSTDTLIPYTHDQADYRFFGDTIKGNYFDSIHVNSKIPQLTYRLYFDNDFKQPNIHSSAIYYPQITRLPVRIKLGALSWTLNDTIIARDKAQSLISILSDPAVEWWGAAEMNSHSIRNFGGSFESIFLERVRQDLDSVIEELSKE